MRQPTFRPGRARPQRYVRIGLVAVVLVAAAALIANLVTGDGGSDPDAPQVAFKTTAVAYADRGSIEEAAAVQPKRVRDVQRAVEGVLEQWYQQTFVDPSVFRAGDDAFPPPGALALVVEDAHADVTGDADALTLGSTRGRFARLVPDVARATITILFQDASKPIMATADVTFRATGTLTDPDADPVRVQQMASFHFEPAGSSWRISYYRADQSQETIPGTQEGR